MEDSRGDPLSSPAMEEHSPDSDPTLNFESEENSPLNVSVINTFNSAYGYAVIDNENSGNGAESAKSQPENPNIVPENPHSHPKTPIQS